MLIPDWILFPAIMLVAAFALEWAAGLRSAGRAKTFRAGEEVAVPARVRGSHHPFTRGYSRGRVVIDDASVVWVPRGGDRVDVVGLGLRAQRLDLQDRHPRHWFEAQQLFSYITVRAHDDAGREVLIRARDEDVEIIVRALRRADDVHAASVRPAPSASDALAPAEPGPPSRGPWVLLTLAIVALATPAFIVATGTMVDAEITAIDAVAQETDVVFTDPWSGEQRATWITPIDGTEVGDTVSVLAARYLLRGDAGQPWELFSIGGLVAVPLLVWAAIWGFRSRRARKLPNVHPHVAPMVDERTLAEVPVGPSATYSRVAEYVGTRARAEQWPSGSLTDLASVPQHDSPVSAIGRWSLLRSVALTILLPVLVAGYTLLLYALPASLDLWAHRTGDIRQASATVDEVDTFLFLDRIAYLDVDGRDDDYFLDAPVTSDIEAGQTVTVAYPIDRPAHVRVLDGDATVAHAIYGWLVVVLALGLAGYLVARRYGPYRSLARVQQEASRRMRFVRTKDLADEDVLLLFDPVSDVAPRYAVTLLPGDPDLLPWSGVVDVHGVIADAEQVVPVIGGRPIWPSSPVIAIDADALAELLDPILWLLDEDSGAGRQPAESTKR